MTFEERLREAMGRAGINQSGLAASAGVNRASVSQYLSGRNRPRGRAAGRLAKALGVDEAWLDGSAEGQPAAGPRVLRPWQAAKALGTNPDSVRIRMQKGRFDPSIGTACSLTGGRYSYEIFPERLAAYLNITVEALYRRLDA
jgi:transcriptional regulator with XRE-family HTH domain